MNKKGKYWLYHMRQYEVMYQSTKHMIQFLAEKLEKEESLSILDVGCGGRIYIG